ncbi:MAG: OmpA family protein [Crocinitomicaceae bacterium]|nr:OmpA family protein [Crocinitomicaceae bacterium]
MKNFLLIFFLSAAYCFSQNVKGVWKGTLYQDPGRKYYFEIRVESIDGNGKISGTTFVMEDKTENFGTIAYSGTFKDNTLSFQETEILKEVKEKEGGFYSSNSWYWCIKNGKLKLSEEGDKYVLRGPWQAKDGCPGGTLKVEKDKPKEPPKEDDPLDCDNPKSAEFMLGAWRGRFHQHACNVYNTYPMVVLIDKVDGMKFSGVFIWTDMMYAEDSRSTLEGEIKNGKVYFYENEIISGSGLVLNGTYKSTLEDCEKLSGYWFLEKMQGQCNDPQVLENGGDFDLEHYEIPTIYFDKNSSELRPESIQKLNEFLKFMKDFPSLKFTIGGHTDNDGSNAWNKVLSKERAKAVIDYLVSKGASESRFIYKYYAHTQPAEKNDSESHMQLNRRTEILVVRK